MQGRHLYKAGHRIANLSIDDVTPWDRRPSDNDRGTDRFDGLRV